MSLAPSWPLPPASMLSNHCGGGGGGGGACVGRCAAEGCAAGWSGSGRAAQAQRPRLPCCALSHAQPRPAPGGATQRRAHASGAPAATAAAACPLLASPVLLRRASLVRASPASAGPPPWLLRAVLRGKVRLFLGGPRGQGDSKALALLGKAWCECRARDEGKGGLRRRRAPRRVPPRECRGTSQDPQPLRAPTEHVRPTRAPHACVCPAGTGLHLSRDYN